MEYQTGKTTVDLSFKVFTADLELAVAHNYNVALNLGQPGENPEAASQIKRYLSATFRLTMDNNPAKISSLTQETEQDATWIHASYSVPEPVHHFKIHNAILMDIYMDQTNLLIMAFDQKETGHRFDFYNREVLLNY